ncbi:helicase POLQ-like isoform X1 [Hippocampus zosterae]|uniref:helicase POLQ-like isoform X1 n=1 Tax=Hippocampus zosterae TaxID=109293 RepID=UPI00223E0E50|nr:helicase POLQ-like isoform X1 [Hippocampus zosterae]
MDDKQQLEYSDSEDLFGDYDSFLDDESLLAKLEQADKMVAVGPAGEDCFLAADAPDTDAARENSPHGCQKAKRRKVHGSSTPHGSPEDRKRHGGAMRRSISERVKMMLRSNATAPAGPSRSAAMKEAALSHEIGGAVRAVEAARADANDLGPFFGLPAKVKDLLFTLRGIRSLYAWQETCLGLDCVSARRNLIYTLPTSGGKTLVAELLMIRELLCRNNNCIFVLPYVALVQEKVRGLAGLGLELDFLVEEYAGSKGRFPPVKRRGKRSLYVATIEKAHALVNALIEEDALSRVGLLVVDELHMLGEGSRGALLEITLAKVLHLSQDTQIIGMSATLGNIAELQTFLKAENYHDDFRPVRLKEYVKLGDGIYEVDPKEEECFRLCRRVELKYSSAMQKVDPDHIIALVTEVIPKHSCLVFCPTKKNCENVAVMICKYLRRDFLQHRQEDKEALLRDLKGCGNGQLCPILRRTVPLGVAYHHSGLTGDERKLLEDAYSAGVLCLIACTSTLAAGINLPARRVIVRSPLVARDAVKTSQYKQMAGRAGRAGLDSEGESILILQEAQREQAKALLCAPVENCYSCLLADDRKSLLSLILSLVGLKVASRVEDLEDFARGTLLFVQRERAGLCLEDVLRESVDLLKIKGLLHVQGHALQVTHLGRATFKGCVDVSHSEILYQDLQQGLEGLLLSSFLHLIFLVTPYDLAAACTPDWMTFYTQMSLLSSSELKMCAMVGVPESLVARKAAGQSVNKSANMWVVKRVYLSLVLMSLLKDGDVWGVAQKFQLTRGFIQSLLNSAAAFCSCVLHFTQELETLWPYCSLLETLTRRLSYCVKAELIPLMEVAGVMEARAKQLHAAGYTTLSHLANTDATLLVRAVERLSRKQATLIVASAKMLLIEKAAALQQEVDHLLAAPPDLPD